MLGKSNFWPKSMLVELATIRKIFLFMSLIISIAYVVPALVTVSSFATYALVMKETITPAKVFSALALFNSLKSPLQSFPHTVTGLLQIKISLGRI